VDISWIMGLVVPGILYYAFGRASRQRAPEELVLPAQAAVAPTTQA
jgi:NCS1 family nucleobase:cation symporter-1